MANVTPSANLHASQRGAARFLRGGERRAGIRR